MARRKPERILLVEPAYKNKYPPLGLMKIATAHRLLGDDIQFVKGMDKDLRDQRWDHIYITTMFTFHWSITVETIRFYDRGESPITVGGVLASLMPNEIEAATGIRPHVGTLTGDLARVLSAAERCADLEDLLPEIAVRGIDALPPDYGIFQEQNVPYRKTLDECYILRTTKGCHRNCAFCAVQVLEPEFVKHLAIGTIVSYIDKRWGPRQNLVLLDDNVLHSPKFEAIIEEIRTLGFEKGAHRNNRRRYVDFNQGLDTRLLTKRHLKALSTLELRPLRLAFDRFELHDVYLQKVHWAIEAGFSEISSYVLYNFNDTPRDFFRRIEIGCKINEQKRCRLYSFPMKYIPCGDKDRSHLGPNWTRRQIRGVQCILNASYGIVPTNPSFFRAAFGGNVSEFLEILQMPENYIIGRGKKSFRLGLRDWRNRYRSLASDQRRQLKRAISKGKGKVDLVAGDRDLGSILAHYVNENNHEGTTTR